MAGTPAGVRNSGGRRSGGVAPVALMPASSFWNFSSASTASLVSSSRQSIRRRTNIGRMTSRYFPRTKTSRRQSSAMDQMNETILLWVA